MCSFSSSCGDGVWCWWLSCSSCWDTLFSSFSTNWARLLWSFLKLEHMWPHAICFASTLSVCLDCVLWDTSAVAGWDDLWSSGCHLSLCSASAPAHSRPPGEEPAYESFHRGGLRHYAWLVTFVQYHKLSTKKCTSLSLSMLCCVYHETAGLCNLLFFLHLDQLQIKHFNGHVCSFNFPCNPFQRSWHVDDLWMILFWQIKTILSQNF